jgi:hypothetical protein
MSTPSPDPDGYWPACDDEQPGVSIRPLSHADRAALLAHLQQHDPGRDVDHDQDLDGGRPGRARRRRWWRCGCAPPSAGLAPPPRRSIGAGAPRSGRPGPAPWLGGPPSCSPAARWSGSSLGSWSRSWPARPGCWPPPRWVGRCGSASRQRPAPGGAGQPGSGAPPASSGTWSSAAGWCCTTWPSPARLPTSIIW